MLCISFKCSLIEVSSLYFRLTSFLIRKALLAAVFLSYKLSSFLHNARAVVSFETWWKTLSSSHCRITPMVFSVQLLPIIFRHRLWLFTFNWRIQVFAVEYVFHLCLPNHVVPPIQANHPACIDIHDFTRSPVALIPLC